MVDTGFTPLRPGVGTSHGRYGYKFSSVTFLGIGGLLWVLRFPPPVKLTCSVSSFHRRDITKDLCRRLRRSLISPWLLPIRNQSNQNVETFNFMGSDRNYVIRHTAQVLCFIVLNVFGQVIRTTRPNGIILYTIHILQRYIYYIYYIRGGSRIF